jgi:prepilin-type N-terminal cleavage/methylation domain-containing protein
MLPYNAPPHCRRRNANLGFSLAEITATLVVIGILAAIGIPNFLGMYQRFQANSAFDKVRGAIQETQLQAMRLGTTSGCTLKIDEAAKTITVDAPADDPTKYRGCLLEKVKLPDSTIIKSNNDAVKFDYKGNTPSDADVQTIVVSDNTQDYKKCLVISVGIGMMRSGFYNDSLTDISEDSCDTE